MDPAKSTSVNKTTIIPFTTATKDTATKSSSHKIKKTSKKVPKSEKSEKSSSKSSRVSSASTNQLNSFKLQEPISKSNLDSSTKNLFTDFSANPSLKCNTMLLSDNCDKSWPGPIIQSTDKTMEAATATKGFSSTSSIRITQEDKTKSPCNCCETANQTCDACNANNDSTNSTSMFTNSNTNINTSNFFKTANSTMYVNQQSPSLIISSPFKHLMVGPKISNMPTPFNGPLTSSPVTPSQEQTPVTNVHQETTCKILFPSRKGENLSFGSPPADQTGVPQTNGNAESVPAILNSKASRNKSRRARYATTDPEQLALIRQRKRDRKFRKLQSLSALMRAPDDRHSMGPLTALKRESFPNTLGLSNHNLSPKLRALSSNPFFRPSSTGGNQLNKFSPHNPWKGENTKKPCSFIHEPSSKNSAIHSPNPLELPTGKFDYQKALNSSDLWKSLGSTTEFRSSSVIDDALRIAALKFIKNEVKGKESTTQKDATPISAEIFGNNKVKTPNIFLPGSTKNDNGSEPAASSSVEENIKEESTNKMAAPSLEDDKPDGQNAQKPTVRPVVKSHKRPSSSKRRISANGTIFKRDRSAARDRSATRDRSVTRDCSVTHDHSVTDDSSVTNDRSSTNDLKRPAENQFDESPSLKETENIYPESKRIKVSVEIKEKRLLVNTKRRGRPPLPNKLKVFKSVERRGRPPMIAAMKAKLQRRAVNSRRIKCKVQPPSSLGLPKRRGRPPKNLDALPVKMEVPKLTDEEVLKVKLNLPRRRGRPSKAEAMLREMAVAHLASTRKDVNTGLGLTTKPRPARRQSSASRQQYHRQDPSGSGEDVGPGSYATQKIKSEPVSLEESTSGERERDAKLSANNLVRYIKEESTMKTSGSNLTCTKLSAFDNDGQRKRKPFKKTTRKVDPDYVKRKLGLNKAAPKEVAIPAASIKKEDMSEDENAAPANRSRPLLLRNVKKNSKPLPTFTDSSEESDPEESTDMEYASPKPRAVPKPKFKPPIKIFKPPMKICKPVNVPFSPQSMPPIYNVPKVLLPPSIKDTGIPCKMCGKVHTRDHFFKYMELKTTDQPHRCPLCSQYFTWSCLFIEHMRSHPENTAQYRCEYCNAVSRKISAYFNCRITHSPPSKEWLHLQKTCDDYLASLNEEKERKNARYTKMITNKIVKPVDPAMLSKTYMFNANNQKNKTGRPPKITQTKSIKLEVSSSATNAKDFSPVNLNEVKDKKTGRMCSKITPNKVIKQEPMTQTTAENKETMEKVQVAVGKTKNSKSSGQNNPASKKPFSCNVCQKSFLTFDFLTKHNQLHKSKPLYSCKICGKQFSTQAFFMVHKRTYHSDAEEKSLKCDVCDLTFSYLIAYNTHISLFGHLSEEEHRKRSVYPHVCDICRRGFKIKSSLLNHMRTHRGTPPNVSEASNKNFTPVSNLERHRRISQQDVREKPRRQEKIYFCKPCKKNFTQETAYNNHMRSHTEDDRFYCDVCEKTYPTAQLLKTHKHNEQRPYKCKCGRCYKLKESLIEHKRVCGLS